MLVVKFLVGGGNCSVEAGRQRQSCRGAYRQIALGFVVALALCGQAMASTFVVSSLSDSGTGSLRDAIMQANASPGAAPHTISLTSITGTIPLDSELPTVAVATTFNGPTTGTLTITRNVESKFSILTIADSVDVTLTYLTITNGASLFGGGVNAGGALTVQFCTFTNNSAIGTDVADIGDGYYDASTYAYGGAIACTGALVVEDSTFTDNNATGGSSSFSGQSAAGASGGAIRGMSTVGLVRTTMTNNTARGGGATDSTAGDSWGGAVDATGTLTVQHCTILNNDSIAGDSSEGNAGSAAGGGLYTQSTVVAFNSSINSNTATGGSAPGSLSVYGGSANGGAIYSYYLVSLTNCDLDSNAVYGGDAGEGSGGYAAGGAVYVTGGYTIINSTFTRNSVFAGSKMGTSTSSGFGGAAAGGGLYASSGETASITGSSFSGNEIYGGSAQDANAGSASGGGIYTTVPVTITNSGIASNIAMGGAAVVGEGGYAPGGYAKGGGIFSNNALTFVGGSVASNTATGGNSDGTSAGNANGGGIYCNDALSITSTTISGNRAQGGAISSGSGDAGSVEGGGISVAYNLELINATVRQNVAQSGFSSAGYSGSSLGGGIFQNNSVSLTITGSTISNNSAYGQSLVTNGGGAIGGGIYSGYANVDITDSTFTGNAVDSSAEEEAAISGLGLGNSYGTIKNAVIAANQSFGEATFGGAILVEYGEVEFINCTIVNNTNEASEGGGLLAIADSFAATNCIFSGNSPSQIVDNFGQGSSESSLSNSVDYSIVQGGFTGTGNLDVDPLFIDANTLDFRLFAGSPAIDAADGNVAPVLDRNSNPRYDDPNTSNTGNGSVIADIGAFEFQPDSSYVQSLVLYPGWNLVSLPFVPTTPTIAGLFGVGTAAFAWNPSAQDYEDISVITAGRGFYVYNDQASVRVVYAYALSRGLAFMRALRIGWNVQGPIIDKLQPTAESRIIIIYTYNPSIDDYEQVVPSGGNYSLQTGKGYFMYCYPGFDLNL